MNNVSILISIPVAKAAGLDPDQFPEDAEISPELLDALASQKLTPDDIAIFRDEETGRPIIKSRQELNQALGGVQEGHIYMAPNGKGEQIIHLEKSILSILFTTVNSLQINPYIIIFVNCSFLSLSLYVFSLKTRSSSFCFDICFYNDHIYFNRS